MSVGAPCQSLCLCLQWHSREDNPPIPRLVPPSAEAGSRTPPTSLIEPTAPPVRHVQFASSTPPSPGVDGEGVQSPTKQSMPQPLAGSSVAAALEDDLEDVQRVGGVGREGGWKGGWGGPRGRVGGVGREGRWKDGWGGPRGRVGPWGRLRGRVSLAAAVHGPPPPSQEAKAAKVPFLKKSVAVMEATMWWVVGQPARLGQS